VILSQPNAEAGATSTLAITPPLRGLGEILTIAGSFAFTAQILALDRYGSGADARRFTLAMFIVVAIISFLFCMALGGWQLCAIALWRALCADPTWLWSLAAITLLSSVVAFHLLNYFRQSSTAWSRSSPRCGRSVSAPNA
jgi:hypothetical protein